MGLALCSHRVGVGRVRRWEGLEVDRAGVESGSRENSHSRVVEESDGDSLRGVGYSRGGAGDHGSHRSLREEDSPRDGMVEGIASGNDHCGRGSRLGSGEVISNRQGA